MAFVEFENVGKTYHMGEVEIHALHDTSFEVEKGELVVIVGPSGAGKTTLLNILGGMDTLTTGRVLLDGRRSERRTSPASCPAASSSGLPLPGHWRRTPSFCCAMSLPARWITRPARRFCSCCRIPDAEPV